ncbi:MAG: phosphohydrolase [Oleiphilus sp.]|nr:MAG: phosphohydrolase [Oleiphilus sp.]
MFEHEDSFGELNKPQSIEERLSYLHQALRARHPFLDRIAVALYNKDTDMLCTYVASSEQAQELDHYDAKLSDCSSLMEILERNQPRVVNDLSVFGAGTQVHTQLIDQGGYLSSYTLPLFAEGLFLGFVFFNSRQKNVFVERILRELDMAGHLMAFMLYGEQSRIKTLVATVRSAREISTHRDPETGSHLERMAHYSRLIAAELAERYGFSDSYIEHVFLFSPLHDIGKLTIPDNILLKPGKLSKEEFEVMQEHSRNGRDIIDKLLSNYGLDGVEYIELLKNIALYHHEAVDGSGYPEHLKQQDIPIEARIVSVADVFDALTSQRPYKAAWSNEEAFAKLREMAGTKLDRECVDALLKHSDRIVKIQKAFVENVFG